MSFSQLKLDNSLRSILDIPSMSQNPLKLDKNLEITNTNNNISQQNFITNTLATDEQIQIQESESLDGVNKRRKMFENQNQNLNQFYQKNNKKSNKLKIGDDLEQDEDIIQFPTDLQQKSKQKSKATSTRRILENNGNSSLREPCMQSDFPSQRTSGDVLKLTKHKIESEIVQKYGNSRMSKYEESELDMYKSYNSHFQYMNKSIQKEKNFLFQENDNSEFWQVSKKKIEHPLIQAIQSLLIKIPVFAPSNTIVVIWNFSMLILTIFQFLFIPIKIAFHIKMKDINLLGLYIAPVIYSFINMVVCFNMGFYEGGQIITQRQSILYRYFKGEFWWDFIPTISFILTEENDKFHFNLYEKYTTITRLTKLIFIIISVAHYVGSGFIYIGRIQKNNDQSWIVQLSSENQFSQYVDAFYFSVITMSTVGYGDYQPVTQTEKIYVVFITI